MGANKGNKVNSLNKADKARTARVVTGNAHRENSARSNRDKAVVNSNKGRSNKVSVLNHNKEATSHKRKVNKGRGRASKVRSRITTATAITVTGTNQSLSKTLLLSKVKIIDNIPRIAGDIYFILIVPSHLICIAPVSQATSITVGTL